MICFIKDHKMTFLCICRLRDLPQCPLRVKTGERDHRSHEGELSQWRHRHSKGSHLARVHQLSHSAPSTERPRPALLLSVTTWWWHGRHEYNTLFMPPSEAPKLLMTKDQTGPAKLTVEHFYSSLMFWLGCVTCATLCFIGECTWRPRKKNWRNGCFKDITFSWHSVHNLLELIWDMCTEKASLK